MDERRKYLEGKLQCKVSVDSASQSRQAPGRPHTSTQARGGASASRGGASESVTFLSPIRTNGKSVFRDIQRDGWCRYWESGVSERVSDPPARGLDCCKIQRETSR